MDDGSVFTLARADGATRFGRVWDADRPRAVLSLVHGFGEHSGRYDIMAKHLNAHGISVVAIDLTGHGRTLGKRGVTRAFDDFRGDLSALLEKSRALYPNLPHMLYGHSMGGGIVLDHGFAPDPDIRAIIATGPLLKLKDNPPAIMRGLARVIKTIAPKGAMKQPIDGQKISTLKAEQRLYIEDPLNHGSMGFGTAVGIVEAGEATLARAEDWTLPLLLMHARDDALTDCAASEEFAARAPNTKFHAFDNVAHEVHNDVTRAKVHELMALFIDDHIRPRSQETSI